MTELEPDPIAILKALGIEEVTKATRITVGTDTTIWRVECPGKVYALRLFRPEQAEVCRHEAEVMKTVAAKLPVPKIYAQSVWEGRPVLLMEWSAGRSLLDELSAHPWRIWQLGVALGRMQAKLHSIAAPEHLQKEANDWIEMAPPNEALLKERLRRIVPLSDHLLHLDYHPLNVLTDGRKITAILDWSNVRAGDPRADYARTVTLLRLAPAKTSFPSWVLIAIRRVLEYGWRYGYSRVGTPPNNMALFYAWAGAVMDHDLSRKLDHPSLGLKPGDMARIRRWTADWKRRASL